MKKIMKENRWFLSTVLVALLGITSLTGCLESGDETIVLENGNSASKLKEYFAVDDVTVEYNDGVMPGGDNRSYSVEVSTNTQILPGGSAILQMTTNHQIKYFYVSIEGVRGYYVIRPKNPTISYNRFIYNLTLLFTQMIERDIHVYVGGLTIDDINLYITDFWFRYHEAATGALQVSLSFNNAKDIDLHVYTPSGKHYYFGQPGGIVTLSNGQTAICGLDVDSNAGCEIDNINNENISFPEEMVENGIYKVVVNMYGNCNSNISTDWVITAYRGGKLLSNEYGSRKNPVYGNYPIGARNGDMSQVMTFTIRDAAANRAKRNAPSLIFKPFPIPESAKRKAEWLKIEKDYKAFNK